MIIIIITIIIIIIIIIITIITKEEFQFKLLKIVLNCVKMYKTLSVIPKCNLIVAYCRNIVKRKFASRKICHLWRKNVRQIVQACYYETDFLCLVSCVLCGF